MTVKSNYVIAIATFLHSKDFKFLHCLGLIALLSANQNREIFSCILLYVSENKSVYENAVTGI